MGSGGVIGLPQAGFMAQASWPRFGLLYASGFSGQSKLLRVLVFLGPTHSLGGGFSIL